MSGFERPGPDVAKITSAWRSWRTGGDDVYPGRTMSDLKIGGLDVVIDTLTADAHESIGSIAEAWSAWERGRSGPNDTLAALDAGGIGDIIAALED